MIYLITHPGTLCCGVVNGENAADAALAYDGYWQGHDKQNDLILECDDSINTYCEQLLTEYDVVELDRAQVMKWVERRLNGDTNITILLRHAYATCKVGNMEFDK